MMNAYFDSLTCSELLGGLAEARRQEAGGCGSAISGEIYGALWVETAKKRLEIHA